MVVFIGRLVSVKALFRKQSPVWIPHGCPSSIHFREKRIEFGETQRSAGHLHFAHARGNIVARFDHTTLMLSRLASRLDYSRGHQTLEARLFARSSRRILSELHNCLG